MNKDKLEELKERLADIKKRWPAHTPSPALMQQLDELEEELRDEIMRREKSAGDKGVGMQELRLCPIGHVENEFEAPASPERIRSVVSRLVIDPSLVEGLKGLEPGQQVMVIFYFHLSRGYDLLQHPRGDPSLARCGVFALHSPNRPNPIGVTVVDLISIAGNVLQVRGLDAINGTPLLDLKAV